MTDRRQFLKRASLWIAAPAIIKTVGLLMPVKRVPPIGEPWAFDPMSQVARLIIAPVPFTLEPGDTITSGGVSWKIVAVNPSGDGVGVAPRLYWDMET